MWTAKETEEKAVGERGEETGGRRRFGSGRRKTNEREKKKASDKNNWSN